MGFHANIWLIYLFSQHELIYGFVWKHGTWSIPSLITSFSILVACDVKPLLTMILWFHFHGEALPRVTLHPCNSIWDSKKTNNAVPAWYNHAFGFPCWFPYNPCADHQSLAQLGLKIGYPQISYCWTSLSLLKNKKHVGCKPQKWTNIGFYMFFTLW